MRRRLAKTLPPIGVLRFPLSPPMVVLWFGPVAFEAARCYDLPGVQSHCEAHAGLNGCTGAMRRSNLSEQGRLAKKWLGNGTSSLFCIILPVLYSDFLNINIR